MKIVIAIFPLLVLVYFFSFYASTDQEFAYRTYREADAGLGDWLPDNMPKSSYDIIGYSDLDNNVFIAEFGFEKNEDEEVIKDLELADAIVHQAQIKRIKSIQTRKFKFDGNTEYYFLEKEDLKKYAALNRGKLRAVIVVYY